MEGFHQWFHLSPALCIDIIGHVSEASFHPRRQDPPHWVLVLVEKGWRTLYLNGRELRAGPRDFLLLPPGFSQAPLEKDDHEAYFLHFCAPLQPVPAPVQLDTAHILLPICGHLPTDLDCLAHIRYLYAHFSRPYTHQAFLSAQLQALLFAISLHAQRSKLLTSGLSASSEKLVAYIETHACEPLHAVDYETAFQHSYHHLNVLFKQRFGCTLKQYHQRARMRRAAELLLTGKTIHHAAQLCGYDDYYFFIRSFKQEYGMTPGQYLKQNGNILPGRTDL